MRRKAIATLLCILALTTTGAYAEGGQQQDPAGEITNITGDIYRAEFGGRFTVFLVTPEGIVLSDPIGTPAAEWLKAELDERFDVPVRYVVYTHSHFDRSEGGAAFADTAQFVAHENMATMMDGRIPQMPGDILDRNNNGAFDMEEWRGPLLNNRCGAGGARFDTDGDGKVTPTEYYAQIIAPDIIYSERMRLTLGGKTIELMHPGLNHAADTTVILFSDERVAFTSGFITEGGGESGLRRWPTACGPVPGFDSHPMAEWVRSFEAVEALDFDILVNGHQTVQLTRGDVRAYIELWKDLVREVSAGMSAGLGLEELKDTLLFEEYSDWEGYENRRLFNIEAAYNNLTIYR